MRRLALALALVLASAPAFAQTTVVQEPDRIVTVKKSVLDFTDVKVEANRAEPLGDIYKARAKGHRRNLMELRANFRPELSASQGKL